MSPNMVQASLHIEIEKGTAIEDANVIAHEVEKSQQSCDCDYCIIHVDPAKNY